MTLSQLLDKHELSATYLARRIGMPKGTFNNKLKGNVGSIFTGPEMARLLVVLLEIKNDLSQYT